MKIGIDIRSTLRRKTGIGYYTFNLINHLSKIDKENSYCLYSKIGLFNKEKALPFLKGRNFRHRINRLNLNPKLFLRNLDVFHTSHYDLVKPKKLKLVLVVHGLIHKRYPAGHTSQTVKAVEQNLRCILPQADKIITPSFSTKRDLLDFYEIDKTKIKVIYPGIGQNIFPIENGTLTSKQELLKEKYNINLPFILYVGTLEPRENVEGLINAYKILKEDFKSNHQLVIVGMKGWLYEKIFTLVEKFNLKDKIIFTDYICSDDLSLFYQCADVFVYPSFCEGVGFPILEALSFGLPVVTSNVSALAEIAGDAALLIDPYKPQEIAEAILNIIKNEDIRKKLKKRGVERVKEFSWNTTAQKTLKVFYECAS